MTATQRRFRVTGDGAWSGDFHGSLLVIQLFQNRAETRAKIFSTLPQQTKADYTDLDYREISHMADLSQTLARRPTDAISYKTTFYRLFHAVARLRCSLDT